MSDVFNDYGHEIGCDGEDARNISEVIAELEEIEREFANYAQGEPALFLQGRADMLNEVIQYLRRV